MLYQIELLTLKYAIEKEKGIVNPYTGRPQILRIAEVTDIIQDMTDDDDVVAAAILHGVNEDNRLDMDEIREIFRDKIADLLPPVSYMSSFVERKKELVLFLENKATEPQKKIILANELANIRMLRRVYDCIDDQVWARFGIDDSEEMDFICFDFEKAFKGLKSYREYEEYQEIREGMFGSCSLWDLFMDFFGFRNDYEFDEIY